MQIGEKTNGNRCTGRKIKSADRRPNNRHNDDSGVDFFGHFSRRPDDAQRPVGKRWPGVASSRRHTLVFRGAECPADQSSASHSPLDMDRYKLGAEWSDRRPGSPRITAPFHRVQPRIDPALFGREKLIARHLTMLNPMVKLMMY